MSYSTGLFHTDYLGTGRHYPNFTITTSAFEISIICYVKELLIRIFILPFGTGYFKFIILHFSKAFRSSIFHQYNPIL